MNQVMQAVTWFSLVRMSRILFLALLLMRPLFAQSQNALNSQPPQVTLEIRLIELEGIENKPVGFDWYSGNALLPGAGSQRGAAPNFPGTPPPQTNAVGTISGILTDPQFRMVIRALEQRQGSTTLARPELVTLSGKPALLRRPDGWKFEVLPLVDAAARQVTMQILVSQEKGEYAGFSLTSSARIGAGETAIYSDVYAMAPKKRNAPKTSKRLLLLIKPTILNTDATEAATEPES